MERSTTQSCRHQGQDQVLGRGTTNFNADPAAKWRKCERLLYQTVKAIDGENHLSLANLEFSGIAMA